MNLDIDIDIDIELDDLKKYYCFDGEVDRTEFSIFWIFYIAFFVILSFISEDLKEVLNETLNGISDPVITLPPVVDILYFMIMMYFFMGPPLSITVCRLRDADFGSAYLLVFLIPFIGPFILLWILFKSGYECGSTILEYILRPFLFLFTWILAMTLILSLPWAVVKAQVFLPSVVEKALVFFDESYELESIPDSLENSNDNLTEACVRYFNNKDYKQATTACTESYNIRPNDALLEVLFKINMHTNDLETAESILANLPSGSLKNRLVMILLEKKENKVPESVKQQRTQQLLDSL